MGREKVYFLVARNRQDNSFQVVPTGKYYGSSLEEIDLFTIRFRNSLKLTQDLIHRGILSFSEVDFFIASQGKENSVGILEVLYSNSKRIQSIATNSMQKRIQNSEKEIDQILNSFCYRMQHDTKFYDYILFGQHDLYPKFVNYFLNRRYEPVYDVKFKDGKWVRHSYVLIHSILDTVSEYDDKKYSKLINDDYRGLLIHDLYPVLDRDYDEKQFTWEQLSQNRALRKEEKITKVLNTIQEMGDTTFVFEGLEFVFSKDEFLSYEIGDFELMSDLLTPSLRTQIFQYLSSRNLLISLLDSHENTSACEKAVQKWHKKIVDSLSSSDQILEDAYRFCLLYNKYSEGIKGDIHGREYQRI